MRVLLAIGGSTNGIVHLTAIAGRLGLKVDMEAFDRIGKRDAGAGRPQAARASTIWKTSTRPAACARCCAS